MNLEIIDRIKEQSRKAENLTKEQMDRARGQFKELHTRGRDLVSRGSENIKHTADRSRRNITLAEAQALDTVTAWMDRLHKATGERAEWLDRGRELMEEVAHEIRVGNLGVEDLPIADYDSLGVKKIGVVLEDLTCAQRELIRAYEITHKNRVTVYRAIDRFDAADTAEA